MKKLLDWIVGDQPAEVQLPCCRCGDVIYVAAGTRPERVYCANCRAHLPPIEPMLQDSQEDCVTVDPAELKFKKRIFISDGSCLWQDGPKAANAPTQLAAKEKSKDGLSLFGGLLLIVSALVGLVAGIGVQSLFDYSIPSGTYPVILLALMLLPGVGTFLVVLFGLFMLFSFLFRRFMFKGGK